ncbi:DUF4097 family beta strand repeat-containing protein [Limosilactobacillus oris]|uniref:DUF4097 family beta strand repeat-containing protein n=1 Tax=Limosilactobacillus oris TaxID=1632 RepID=UPI00265AC4DF|nr:DUF4097 family beta strand repeat-containing protein [Limosilactobacillus oris]
MKKLFKISLGLLIVGLILTAIGFWGHGARDVHFAGPKPVITKNVSKSLVTNQHFDRLDINATTADIRVRTGREFKVSYQGSSALQPKAAITDQLVTVKQTQTAYGTIWGSNSSADVITITVPKGTKLAGTIKTTSGDVTVNGVDLTGVTIDARDGDVDLRDLTVEGGKARVESGDFTSRNVTFRGSYFVNNSDGDNEVVDARVDGYFLKTTDGDNEIDGADHDSGQQSANENAANLLHLTSEDGDNTIKNIQAVE